MQINIPHLRQTPNSKQLYVHGRPFLVLGAELQNSSLSSSEYMQSVWPRLVDANINTVLGSVSWAQIEPTEGVFDFKELDQVVLDARSHGLHLILLWFGSFKNGLSTYAPAWVKTNNRRFPRVELRNGKQQRQTSDILSLFSENTRTADSKAFGTFMDHIRDIDEKHSTVIMVQVENEVGVLGDSRDNSPLASDLFNAPVPKQLLTTISEQWGTYHHSIRAQLQQIQNMGATASNKSWQEYFGDSLRTDELFMAYHYALYVETVAAAGKAKYPLPMYTNVWQNYGSEDRDKSFPVIVGGGCDPGDYPSGGGVINVLDIWQSFAPSLDFIAPDIYLNDYSKSCANYRHRNQPLFIPEQRRDEYGARRIWTAFATYQAIGAAPFGIDTVEVELGFNPFKKHYELLSQVASIILSAQAAPGSSFGFYFDDPKVTSTNGDPECYTVTFGDWHLSIQRSFVFGKPSPGCGAVIYLDEKGSRFLLIGWGFQVSFKSTKPKAHFTGILRFVEKEITDRTSGEMKTGRILNGDETLSGKSAIMPSANPDYGDFPISICIPAKTCISEVEVYALET